MAEETVLQSSTIIFDNDFILRVSIRDGAIVDLKQAKLMTETMRKYAINGQIPVLIDARASYSWEKDAQKYIAENSEFRLATAVITNNSISRLLTNTFVKIFKPSYPVRIFSNEPEAIEWLKSQLKK